MARPQGQPVYRGAEVNGAIPACEFRTAGHRVDCRRPEGVYETFYRQSRPAHRGRRLGNDRIHLPRESNVPEAHRPGAQVERLMPTDSGAMVFIAEGWRIRQLTREIADFSKIEFAASQVR